MEIQISSDRIPHWSVCCVNTWIKTSQLASLPQHNDLIIGLGFLPSWWFKYIHRISQSGWARSTYSVSSSQLRNVNSSGSFLFSVMCPHTWWFSSRFGSSSLLQTPFVWQHFGMIYELELLKHFLELSLVNLKKKRQKFAESFALLSF